MVEGNRERRTSKEREVRTMDKCTCNWSLGMGRNLLCPVHGDNKEQQKPDASDSRKEEEARYGQPWLRVHRKPQRIPGVLKELEKIWRRYPSLRLGQLIGNVIDERLYFIEDDDLMRGLHEYYDKLELEKGD